MRLHAREDCVIDVELLAGGASYSGKTVNLSQGGAFVHIGVMLPVGSRIELLIQLPGVPNTCRIPAIVRWSAIERGLGVQFESLRPIEVWAINRIVRSRAMSA